MKRSKELEKLKALIPALEDVGKVLYELQRYGYNQTVNNVLDYLRGEKAFFEMLEEIPYHGACLTCLHYINSKRSGVTSLVCPNCRYYEPDWSLPSLQEKESV